jgi:zinc transport system substrate-binding protein
MIRRFHKLIGIIVIVLLICPVAVSAAEKILVFVSILPHKYFVQQIGKELVDVRVMVQPGSDPHTYEPKPQQMVAISKAKLYFAVGIEFEEAKLSKIITTNPKIKVIHTDHGIKKRDMEAHQNHHDGHEEEHHEDDHHKADRDHEKGEHHGEEAHDKVHHEHAGLDPHIWLSPPLVKIQAQQILTALKEIDPANSESYDKNFNEFAAQISQFDAELKKIFLGKTGLQFMVFHPSWGYFADTYGLKQVPIEIEGKDPKPAQLRELIEHARELTIKVIFVQPQFSIKKANVVAREIGGQVVFADPLAYDWMANLRNVADKFAAALK